MPPGRRTHPADSTAVRPVSSTLSLVGTPQTADRGDQLTGYHPETISHLGTAKGALKANSPFPIEGVVGQVASEVFAPGLVLHLDLGHRHSSAAKNRRRYCGGTSFDIGARTPNASAAISETV